MDSSTVVLDIGSHCIKVGLGTAIAPKVIPCIAGTFKYRPVFHGAFSQHLPHTQRYGGGSVSDATLVPSQQASSPVSTVVGQDVEAHRGLLRLSHPVQHGTVVDWAAMTALLRQAEASLRSTAEEDAFSPSASGSSRVYACVEPPFASRVQRRQLVDYLFETGYGEATSDGGGRPGAHRRHGAVRGVFCGVAPLLSLYSTGETTGVVLDVGEGVTSTAAAVNGFSLTSVMQRENDGCTGGSVTAYLESLMRVYGVFDRVSYNSPGGSSATVAAPAQGSPGTYRKLLGAGGGSEREMVRNIKELHCRVSPSALPVIGNVEKNLQGPSSLAAVDNALAVAHSATVRLPLQTHRLPDGTEIGLGEELMQAPEVLFYPALVGSECRGVVDLVSATIACAEVDLRPLLYQNILVTGGTSLLSGFPARLLAEVLQRTPRSNRVRVVAPAERAYTAWLGAVFVSQLSLFATQMVVTREEYMEEGERLLQARLFV